MKNKRRKNKKGIFIILLIILTSLSAVVYYLIHDKNMKEKIELNTINEIQGHYNGLVITNKEAIIFDENTFEVGKIGKGVELALEEQEINYNTKYFKITNFEEEYYIKYQDVDKIEAFSSYDNRYKNYIVFNQNIVTNEKTAFYDENNNLVYEFNKSYDLPIIIKDTEKYGVEFEDRLLYVKKEDIKEIKENHNTDKTNASGVGVLNYHFFYDENDPKDSSACREEICVSKAQLIKELDFLDDNNIISIRSNELEMYIDGKLQLPKSVYITVDDGGRNQVGLELFTERKVYATVFLITSWYDPSTYYQSPYIELHSHGDDIHAQYRCNIGKQGGAIQCEDREKLITDLTLSSEKLGGSTVFAYPFYEYNNYAISILKETGFTMAFAGESNYSDNLVKVGMNKYTLPRFVMVNYTTLNDLKRYFGNIK